MAKFLVSKLSPDGLTGEISDVVCINHNLMIIGSKYRDEFLDLVQASNLPSIVQICVCGRFVVYIEMSNDFLEATMKFYDLKNDNDLALDAAKEIQEGWYGTHYFNWFMELFTQLKEVYSDNYDAAELVLVENAGLLLN